MSNDFFAINSLISSVLLVTDCILIKAQLSDFLVAIVRVILDSRFFYFIYRTIFIISSMINVYSYAPSYAIDTFLFYFITFSCVPVHFPQIEGLPSFLSGHLLAM